MTMLEQAPEVRIYRDPLVFGELEMDTRGGRFSVMHGRAVPYGQFARVGAYHERHAPGSFKRSTTSSARALPLLLFHDQRSFPIGASTEWRHEPDGLYGTWKINGTPEAQRAAGAANDGELRGLSVGFVPRDARWEPPSKTDAEGLPRVTHMESRLVETSLTPTPTWEDAEVLLVRSLELVSPFELEDPPPASEPYVSDELAEWKRYLESVRR